MAEIHIEEIMQILPHRYPMLLIDRVIEWGEDHLIAIKNLSINEPFFAGHFPGHPVFPGVLQIEAMAQAGGIWVNRKYQKEGKIAYFLAIDKARFRRMAKPGDQLRIEVKFLRARLSLIRMQGKIFIGSDLASEAEIMFGYGDM